MNTNVKTETIIRTAILFLALINQALTFTGHKVIPIESDQLAELITLAITIGSSLWAWWKNNSFTKEAIAADQYMTDLKAMGNEDEINGGIK